MNERFLLVLAAAAACASSGPGAAPEIPAEAARHSAALATIVVSNATSTPLTIAFRSAAPPAKAVIIGRVDPGESQRMAPVPADEPIIMIARRADGTALALAPRIFQLDTEWTWEISRNATFTTTKN